MKKLFAFTLIAALLLAGCSGQPRPKQVTLAAEDIKWDPPLIEAQVGQEITLTVRNDGALDHNFVSPALGFDILLSPGESQTLSFILTQAGSIEFICDIPGHEDAGMVGEIVVRE